MSARISWLSHPLGRPVCGFRPRRLQIASRRLQRRSFDGGVGSPECWSASASSVDDFQDSAICWDFFPRSSMSVTIRSDLPLDAVHGFMRFLHRGVAERAADMSLRLLATRRALSAICREVARSSLIVVVSRSWPSKTLSRRMLVDLPPTGARPRSSATCRTAAQSDR